jgi:type II secretory pathway pseudopilin PulG
VFQRLRARLTAQSSDAGFGMIEVVAAVMIFMILSVGMAYSMVTATRLTGDTRGREVAAGLAAQEIDAVRAVRDPFKVFDQVTNQTVNGVTYTITRTANWVSTLGSTANCGGGGGNIMYRGVQVKVTWPGSQLLSSPVQSNTDLAPITRLNDPSYGSIIVSVLGADNTGRAGVSVTITQASGGAPVGAVNATDKDGCSYVFKVQPGTYTVSVSSSSFIDYQQVVTPSQNVTVKAGGSQTAPFQYDKQATFTPKYASNFAGPTPKLPDSLVTTYLGSNKPYATTTPSSSLNLFPDPNGYAAIAGSYSSTASTASGCLSVDPAVWPDGKVGSTNMAAGIRQIAAVAPGGLGGINVPMGVVKLTWPGGTSVQVIGAAAPAGTGDPGCAQPTTYTFTYASAPAANSTVYLAVPFGSYQVWGTLLGVFTILPTQASPATQGEMTGNIITLDPRSPK